MRRAVLLSAILANFALYADGTSAEEPLFRAFQEDFQKPYLRIGFLQQTVGEWAIGDQDNRIADGFSIANFRLIFAGELDEGFGYFLQGNLVKEPAMLDARIYYRLNQSLSVHAGLFKAPFSAEYLTSAANIDFVNRARVVESLAPKRQVGVMLHAEGPGTGFSLRVGAFNGNSPWANGNDGDRFLYAGRLTWTYEANGGVGAGPVRVVAGANVAVSRDRAASLAAIYPGPFAGKRALYGGDIRLTVARTLLAAEYIAAGLEPEHADEITPRGYHLTVGHLIRENLQILARWDSFDVLGNGEYDDLLILGLNLWPTSASELQLNYVFPLDDTESRAKEILVNFQISL